MKDDEIYPYFVDYLNEKLSSGNINRGKYSLLKMSSQSFQEFKCRFEEDELFRKNISKLRKSEIRNQKIDDIFDEID